MTRKLTIRPRREEDDRFLEELGELAFSEYAKDAGPHALSMARHAHTLIADLDGTPVGFVAVEFPERHLAHLTAIAVTIDERGTGIGQALLRAAQQLSRTRGARRLRAMTADSNVAALALLFRARFSRAAAPPRRYGRGQRAVLLEVDL